MAVYRRNTPRFTAGAGGGVPAGVAPLGAIVRGSVQAPSARQNSPLAKRHRCSACQIEYEVPNGQRVSCPMCDVERRLHEVQQALMAEVNKSSLLKERLARVQADNDVAEGMRQAVDLLDARDLAFLKQVAYRWRDRADDDWDAGPFRMSVIHTQRKIGRKRITVANGFLLLDPGHEPETHECSSVGGASIAGDYELACRMWSNTKAMELLMRTLVTHLSGRTS